jgi:hypothetical protein
MAAMATLYGRTFPIPCILVHHVSRNLVGCVAKGGESSSLLHKVVDPVLSTCVVGMDLADPDDLRVQWRGLPLWCLFLGACV